MKCEKCGTEVKEEESFEFRGMKVCEDCYFDLMNPPRTCDPRASYSAKKEAERQGQDILANLTDDQKKLLDLIRNRGRVQKEEAAGALGVSDEEAERIFVTLHHMDILKGQKDGDIIYWTSMH